MSEVKSLYGTRTSKYWEAAPAKMDALNLRMIFPSSNRYGFPDLALCDWLPDCLGAWHLPRQRDRAAANNGAVHFFLDDYRFETAFTSPERTVGRVLAVGGALTPDFSLWRDMPRAGQLWNVYRSRWCGAYWQSQGVRVIPTACWARSDTFDFCFDGLPQGGPVAVSALGVRANGEDRGVFRDGLAELVARVQPSCILSYGRLVHVDGLDLPPVREYPTFWDERRKAVKA
ncbi:hypothetical protein SEA_CHASER_123 [Mycobacterium phage Chaser]|nr:hypothetical protein SEA_CHASER_123 [Mycobacterium phage Chaser]